MATILSKETSVRKGRLYLVKNTRKRKFSNAKDTYWALWLENNLGQDEFCALLTERNLESARNRARRNPEDDLSWGFADNEKRAELGFAVVGRIIKLKNQKRKKTQKEFYYAVLAEDSSGNNREQLKFTKKELLEIRSRGEKNPEDLPKKSLIVNLLD